MRPRDAVYGVARVIAGADMAIGVRQGIDIDQS